MIQISELVQGALDWLKGDLTAVLEDIERFGDLDEVAEYEYSLAQESEVAEDREYTIQDFRNALDIIVESV